MVSGYASRNAEEIRVIVAGTRTFEDYSFAKEHLDRIIRGLQEDNPTKKIVMITGDARGTDQTGNRYAYEHGYSLQKFPAKWKTYGKAAGPIRNAQMLKFASCAHPVLVAFWDGKSRGTRNMIEIAKQADVSVYTVRYDI